MKIVSLAIPKGSLENDTFKILERAWYKVYGADRTYRPLLSDGEIELKVLRPQEIPVLVADGHHDVGITGEDWIKETKANVEKLLNLEYGKVKLVIAVPVSMAYSSFNEMIFEFARSNKVLRISTEYLNIASEFIMAQKSYKEIYGEKEPLMITPWWKKGENDKVCIYLSFGATEAKPPEDADCIIDNTQTGTTLERNNLKAIETIMESSAILIANKKALQDSRKREKIYDILTLLKGVVDSEKKLHIFVNVREENLDDLVKSLPALKGPTISKLSAKGWYSVNTVVDKNEFIKLLPTLRRLAQGLVVHEPQQILPLEEIAKDEVKKNEDR
jgi:ATP phosphoribosyltransferase